MLRPKNPRILGPDRDLDRYKLPAELSYLLDTDDPAIDHITDEVLIRRENGEDVTEDDILTACTEAGRLAYRMTTLGGAA